MSLNYVTLTFSEQDAGQDAGSGAVTIVPTSVVTASGQTVVSQVPVVRQMSAGSASVQLVACDNTGTSPAAGFWAYQVTLPGATVPGLYLVNYANGATQRFDSLSPVVPLTTYGPASPGLVTSVNGHVGAVVLAAADVGADASGAATAAAAPKVNRAGDTMTGPLAPKVVALTYAATIAVDATLGNVYAVTLTGSPTISAPTGGVDGQLIRLRVIQGSGGSFTVTWPSGWDWGTPGAPTLSTAAGAIDLVVAEYDAAVSKWLAASSLGY